MQNKFSRIFIEKVYKLIILIPNYFIKVLKIDHRTNTLFLRVERLAQKVSQQSQSSNNLKGAAEG